MFALDTSVPHLIPPADLGPLADAAASDSSGGSSTLAMLAALGIAIVIVIAVARLLGRALRLFSNAFGLTSEVATQLIAIAMGGVIVVTAITVVLLAAS
jgi:hypothetical protein